MRGRTSDSRAPRSARALLGVLLRRRGSSWLALMTALVSAGLAWGLSEGTAMVAQPSAAGEVGASDDTTPPAAGAAAEAVSSEPKEGTDDGRLGSDDLRDALELASDPRFSPSERQAFLELADRIAEEIARSVKDTASREAPALSASIRGLRSMPRKDWPAPLPQMVYRRFLHESDIPEPRRVAPLDVLIARELQDYTRLLRDPLPESPPATTLDFSLDMGPPSLSQLISHRILSLHAPSDVLIAAIELEHNEASFEQLLEYGLSDYVTLYGHSDRGPLAEAAVQALWFLRPYDPTDGARAEVEKALQLDLQFGQKEAPAANQAAERAKYLGSLLASWDFARALSEPRRKAYQEYERRRWMALALSASSRPNRPMGKGGRGGGGGGYSRLAEALALCPWPDGDEDFFLRNFESPASTEEDVRLAGVLAFLQPDGTYRFSDEGIRRLEAVAKGDSFRAKEAARLLPLLKNQKKP